MSNIAYVTASPTTARIVDSEGKSACRCVALPCLIIMGFQSIFLQAVEQRMAGQAKELSRT